jgi:hypothetical protein
MVQRGSAFSEKLEISDDRRPDSWSDSSDDGVVPENSRSFEFRLGVEQKLCT